MLNGKDDRTPDREERTWGVAPPPAPRFDHEPIDLWGSFDPPRLPRGLLPPVIEAFAFGQGARMGADPAGLAMAALATCGVALGDGVRVKVKEHDDWFEAPRLWVGLVGEPSTRKTPIISAATSPLSELEARRVAEWKRAVLAGEKPPHPRRLLIGDSTVEAVQEIVSGSPAGVLMLSDELAGFFGSMDRYKGGKGGGDRAFWLQAYNGGRYKVDRLSRGSYTIPNLSVSLLGGIQPAVIRRVSSASADDGLLQRLFPILLRPAALGHDEPAGSAVADYARLVAALAEGAGERVADGHLRFSPQAQVVRRRLEGAHLELQKLGFLNTQFASHVGKYDGLFARLCVLWHGITHAGDRSLPPLIGVETAERVAAFLHGFLLRHALAFYMDVLGGSDAQDDLSAIAGFILSRRLDVLTSRDIQRGDRRMRQLKKHEMRDRLETLEMLGWVEPVPGLRAGSDARYVVNPVVHQRFAERARREASRRREGRLAVARYLRGRG